MWWQIGLFLVSLALAYLFRPKPEVSKPPPVEDFDISTAEDGATINVLFGTRNIKNHNVVWWGDSGSRVFKVSAGESSWLVDVEDVVGGRYYFVSLHTALCIGPIDHLAEIIVDEKTVWTGENTGGQFWVDAVDIFGGKESGGGIGGKNLEGNYTSGSSNSGSLYLETGETTQAQNTYLQSVLGTDIPAFRGVSCVVAQKLYIGTSPYLKFFEFRCKRIYKSTNGTLQWYPQKAGISNGCPESENQKYFFEDFSTGLSQYSQWGSTTITSPFSIIDTEYGKALQVVDQTTIIPAIHQVLARDIYEDCVYVRRLKIKQKMTIDPPGNEDSPSMLLISEAGSWTFNLRLCDDLANGNCWGLKLAICEINYTYICFPADTSLCNEGDWYEWDVVYDDDLLGYRIYLTDLTSGVIFAETYNVMPMAVASKLGFQSQRFNSGDDYNQGTTVHADVQIWFEPDETCFSGSDMNPAHLIRECLTDTNWGLGYSSDVIDSTSFTAAADTLFDEGLGISIEWTQQSSIWDFISLIKKHIDAELYVSRSTGKFILKLIRADYDADNLTVLDEDNIVSVESVSRPALVELTNSVTVQYWDSCGSMNDASVTVTDQALIDLQGNEINTTIQYPGITNAENAAKVATRDLRVLSSPLLSATIYATRDAEDFYPGDVLILDWPDLGIDRVICRVKEIDLGDGLSNTVRLSVVEDVFSLPETVVTIPDDDDPAWVNPVQPPEAVTYQIAGEMPYHALLKVIGKTDLDTALTSDDDAGWVYAAAVRPGNAIDAKMYTDDGAGYEQVDELQYCGSCLLTAAVDQTDTAWTWDGGTDMGLVAVGMWGQIEDEIIAVSAIDTDAGTMTVLRGVMDTEPRTHADDTRVYFWNGYRGYDRERRQDADSIDVKLLPRTGSGILAIADASAETVVLDERADRPYPPGDLQIDGTPYPTPAIISAASFDVTWEHRDRLTQTALLDHTDTSISTAEAGTTYTVQVYDDNPTLQIEHTGISGKSQTVTMSGEAEGDYTLQLWAVRDGKNSWQCAEWEFEYIIPVAGTGAGNLPQITGTGSGLFSPQFTGTGAGTLPKITGNGYYNPSYTGTGAGTLPLISGSANNYLIYDTFTDSDGTNILSHTPEIDLEGGGYSLFAASGSPTMGIYSNKAKTTDTQITYYGVVLIDSGESDVALSSTMTRATDPAYGSPSLGIRITSASTYWWITMHTSTTTLTIYENNSGSTARATSSCSWAGGATKTMTATANGNTITAWVDGASEVSYASATLNNTITNHGFSLGGTVSYPVIYDDFMVSAL